MVESDLSAPQGPPPPPSARHRGVQALYEPLTLRNLMLQFSSVGWHSRGGHGGLRGSVRPLTTSRPLAATTTDHAPIARFRFSVARCGKAWLDRSIRAAGLERRARPVPYVVSGELLSRTSLAW